MGAALVVALVALIGFSPRATEPLQEAWFDGYQRVAPRRVDTMPAIIVDVDAKSLAALGRWPWPRTLLADLVDRVNRHRPAAVGVDIMMPEPDPLSPERLLRGAGAPSPARARELAELPANDTLLARSLAAAPTVLIVAGMPERTGMPLRAPPFVVQDPAVPKEHEVRAAPRVERFAGAVTAVDELNRAAKGWGIASADPVGGVIRRVPLVAEIDGTLIGALAIELFRVAAGEPALRLVMSGDTVQGIAIGRALVATEADGGARVYFSPHKTSRFVSAVDVLQDRVDPERLRGKLALIAVTGLGLGDFHATPVGERMPGSEIHAQLLENMYDGTLLRRPTWAPVVEAVAVVLLGALLVWATPAWNPRNATLLAVIVIGVMPAAGYAMFRSQRLLLDAATPAAGLVLLFCALLVLTLAEATRQRKAIEQALQRQRERTARLAGELDAARRIQMATLPLAEQLADERRIDLAAAMLPAREVGGDLYDFFRLDQRRLFFLIGDVAGKGLSASIFMAVSKALYKSATLRTTVPDPGTLMTAANAEVSRDNPGMLFVTVFAGILDLETGELSYCNAGHENPCRVHPADREGRFVGDGGGPPLCAVDDFAYHGAQLTLRPGELVCAVSDGVTEAQNAAAELYGTARLATLLAGLRDSRVSAREVVDAVRADVATFAAGAEPSDDLTVLALRWKGPQPVDALGRGPR